MSRFIILLGPPGAGKGTQAEIIADELSIPHISSGDLFRYHLSQETDLGKQARKFIDGGLLVPDEITISMVKERLQQPDCKNGAVLDGFPRTLNQAKELDKLFGNEDLEICCVPYIKVLDQVLIKRLTGRWTCKAAGHVYHEEFNPPQKLGLCDVDGSRLYQRTDDKEETIKNRLSIFHEQTAPLIKYYREKDLLREIDGTQPIEEVTSSILNFVRD